MKLPTAYSLDIKKAMTAELADQLYQEGKISSKFAFECPDEHCHAQVTCANLDKPKHKRRRDPYYKVVGEHSDKCLIKKDSKGSSTKTSRYNDLYSDSDEYYSDAVRLNLQPPSTKRPITDDKEPNTHQSESKARPSSSEDSGKRKIQRSKTPSSFIDAFLANESLTIQLPTVGLIDIQDFFIEIDGQDINDFPDELRIYYGKAWINKHEKGYSFRFANELTSGDLTTRPSTYLSEKDLQQTSFRRFEQLKLDKLANNIPKTVFILSETSPYPNDPYINIWCDGPEYLDYRV
ncbi:MAG: hypothetical protein KTR20_07040 [Cellvibrionaceae bacterium]|nr:hypothetical protein [Cellvibrionaceae bacterium]